MTIFTKIVQREVPAKIVYEDDEFLAFHDIHPQAPVHCLVIPKKEIVSLNQLSGLDDAFVGRFLKTIAKVASTLELHDGFRTVFNTGVDGGQTVSHIHAHILGGRQMQWPPG